METIALNEDQRIELVANRIFAYYLQIIDYKRKNNVTSFVIDCIPYGDLNFSLVSLEDKYDSKSLWREVLEIPNGGDAWHTLPWEDGQRFGSMGENENGQFTINIEKVLKSVSLLLSKKGIANYFDQPNDSISKYFWKEDKAWLTIVL